MTTRFEQRYYADITGIRRALERIADALEVQNATDKNRHADVSPEMVKKGRESWEGKGLPPGYRREPLTGDVYYSAEWL
jgi:hypothetical protein